MAEKFVSERNLKFMLYEVFDCEKLIEHPRYAEHDREMFDMILDAALKLSRDLLRPNLSPMDQNPPEYEAGKVRVHPSVREMMRAFGEGGWIGSTAPMEQGGQQLPLTLSATCRFVFAAANYSASVYPMLTSGAAHLIASFGSEELIETYVEKMFSGQWSGTMALTEPQAGSSLADLKTVAQPTDQGYYLMNGQKIFISNGDHDGADNVVHLMLARVEGAPPGVKGISLFVVPKLRPNGGDLQSNDVAVAGIYHKLGYRGAPLTQLSMGENNDCRGWVVGEPNRGLMYMFQMMNEARIDVGSGAAAIATAAYHASLEYARTRPQGRKPGAKDPSTPQVPIIEHADVKRMLLFQRAVAEGSLGLVLEAGLLADLLEITEGKEREDHGLLLDLLTPVAKSYPSEMSNLSCSQGIQILGGYGYCDEFPLEQYYRDARIHPIHEGTTGIQGMDLLGRKVVIKEGRAYKRFVGEVEKTIGASDAWEDLKTLGGQLGEALKKLTSTTLHLTAASMKAGPEVFLCDATLYLECFGIVSIGWQWLKQAVAARRGLEKGPSEKEVRFYRGKLFTARYFFSYEMPKIEGLITRLMTPEPITVEMKAEDFED